MGRIELQVKKNWSDYQKKLKAFKEMDSKDLLLLLMALYHNHLMFEKFFHAISGNILLKKKHWLQCEQRTTNISHFPGELLRLEKIINTYPIIDPSQKQYLKKM